MVMTGLGRRSLLLAMLIAAMVCCAGCGILPRIGKSRRGGAELPRELDPFELRLGLEQVIDKSMAAIVANASDIAAKTEDRKIRENTVRWKIRANDAFQAVLLEPDARIALESELIIEGYQLRIATFTKPTPEYHEPCA